MFVRLHSSVIDAVEADSAKYGVEIDKLLAAHHRRSLIFALTRADAARLAENLTLGPLSKVALAAIRRRSDDYITGMGRARRYLTLYDADAIKVPFFIDANNAAHAKIEFVCDRYLDVSPTAFVENINSDGVTIKLLYEMYASIKSVPTDLTQVMFTHGGGSGLAQVIQSLPVERLIGFCLSDRDHHPFDPNKPFSAGGTAALAHNACRKLNILGDNDIGYSTTSPFYGFHVTYGRTAEAYIGPYVLDALFSLTTGASLSRKKFTDAFPAFPILDDSELQLWRILHLKDSGLQEFEIKEALKLAGLNAHQINSLNVTKAREAKMLPGAAQKIYELYQAGRHKAKLVAAFKKDLMVPAYEEDVEMLWQMIWDFLSADLRIGNL